MNDLWNEPSKLYEVELWASRPNGHRGSVSGMLTTDLQRLIDEHGPMAVVQTAVSLTRMLPVVREGAA